MSTPMITSWHVSSDPAAPIGVFDSGVGGLTVARRIAAALPNERIIYVADQAHVPYGGRPLEEIRAFAGDISAFLFAEGAKSVVMACNISSATALEDVRARSSRDRAFGVIEPGARAALDATVRGKIGVLATAGTVASRAYTMTLSRLASVEVTEVACPDFVPLVEAGLADSPEAIAAAGRYLAPILAAGADVVVLGCTHYPFLLNALETVAPGVRFIDPALATVDALANALASNNLLATQPARAPHVLTTTKDADTFARQLAWIWPDGKRQLREITWMKIRELIDGDRQPV
jgi:glutamate racemase